MVAYWGAQGAGSAGGAGELLGWCLGRLAELLLTRGALGDAVGAYQRVRLKLLVFVSNNKQKIIYKHI